MGLFQIFFRCIILGTIRGWHDALGVLIKANRCPDLYIADKQSELPVLSPDRKKILDQVIGVIKQNSHASICIKAPWGSGKTNLLKTLSKKLEPDYNIGWINPWQCPLTDIESETLRVLCEICNLNERLYVVEEKREGTVLSWTLTVSGAVISLCKLGIINITGILLTFIGLFFFKKTTTKPKKSQHQLINELKAEIELKHSEYIIIYDDLDRCDAAKVNAVFATISMLSEIRNLKIIAAYDQKYLESIFPKIETSGKTFSSFEMSEHKVFRYRFDYPGKSFIEMYRLEVNNIESKHKEKLKLLNIDLIKDSEYEQQFKKYNEDLKHKNLANTFTPRDFYDICEKLYTIDSFYIKNIPVICLILACHDGFDLKKHLEDDNTGILQNQIRNQLIEEMIHEDDKNKSDSELKKMYEFLRNGNLKEFYNTKITCFEAKENVSDSHDLEHTAKSSYTHGQIARYFFAQDKSIKEKFFLQVIKCLESKYSFDSGLIQDLCDMPANEHTNYYFSRQIVTKGLEFEFLSMLDILFLMTVIKHMAPNTKFVKHIDEKYATREKNPITETVIGISNMMTVYYDPPASTPKINYVTDMPEIKEKLINTITSSQTLKNSKIGQYLLSVCDPAE